MSRPLLGHWASIPKPALTGPRTPTPPRFCRCLHSLDRSKTLTTNGPGRPRPRMHSSQKGPACLPTVQRRGKSKTVEELNSRWRGTGPFSAIGLTLFVGTSAAMWWYFEREKQRLERKRIAEATKGIGKPKVGGPFALTDQDGRPFTDEDMKGRYALVYFGFTRCPDICPEELDKMARMVDLVAAEHPNALLPVFITCDPARDTPSALKTYLAEFHEAMVGLTGAYEEIKCVCKLYRVYFSTPEKVAPGKDYLVDHSIYFYLMDPEGDFVEALGRQHGPDEGARLILDHIGDWRGAGKWKE